MDQGPFSFVNLAVRDLKKSMEFFSNLGFEFDERSVLGPGRTITTIGEVSRAWAGKRSPATPSTVPPSERMMA